MSSKRDMPRQPCPQCGELSEIVDIAGLTVRCDVHDIQGINPVRPRPRPDHASPWKPISDDLQQKVLGKLLEELGEATAVAARCTIQGLDGISPDTGKVNRVWLQEELADVESKIQACLVYFDLAYPAFWARVQKKTAFHKPWFEGTV